MFKARIWSFVVLAALLKICLAITDVQKTQIQYKFLEAGMQCIKEFPLTVDEITSFQNRVFPDNDNAGCFSACVFKNVGLFDDDGTLSQATALEHAKKVFGEEAELSSVEEFLTACTKVNAEEVSDGEKGCQRAKLAFNCFVENFEKFGFNIGF